MSASPERLEFIDTNIIVYSFDEAMGAKHIASNVLLSDLMGRGTLAVSTQVVREFTNVYLKKLQAKDVGAALKYIDTILAPHVRGAETIESLRAATLLTVAHGISFYDALILQAAIELGCKTLYSEDFEHGRTYSGVGIVNPFIK